MSQRLTIKSVRLVYGKNTKYGPKTMVAIETEEYPGQEATGFFDPADKTPQTWGAGTVIENAEVSQNGKYLNFKIANAGSASKSQVTKMINDILDTVKRIESKIDALNTAPTARTTSNPPNRINNVNNAPTGANMPPQDDEQELPF